MENEIKILLTSDLHLGMKDVSAPITESIRLNTFRRITSIAADHDILLIAGDLIDNCMVSDFVLDSIRKEFERLRENGTEIIYTPGVGELSDDGEISQIVKHLGATHSFTEMEFSPYIYSKELQDIYIYGMTPAKGHDILKFRKISDDGFHIGLFHADFNLRNDKKGPMLYTVKLKDLWTLNFDFYALGYNHNFRMFKVQNRIIAAYPGAPEAVSLQDTGDRYVISITVRDNEISQIKRIAVNSIRIQGEKIDCTGLDDMTEVLDAIAVNASPRILQILTLSGKRNFSFNDNDLMKYREMYYNLMIKDRAVPELDSFFADYLKEDSIRGEFFKILEERISDEEVLRDIDADALAVLLNTMLKNGFQEVEDLLCNLSDA